MAAGILVNDVVSVNWKYTPSAATPLLPKLHSLTPPLLPSIGLCAASVSPPPPKPHVLGQGSPATTSQLSKYRTPRAQWLSAEPPNLPRTARVPGAKHVPCARRCARSDGGAWRSPEHWMGRIRSLYQDRKFQRHHNTHISKLRKPV